MSVTPPISGKEPEGLGPPIPRREEEKILQGVAHYILNRLVKMGHRVKVLVFPEGQGICLRFPIPQEVDEQILLDVCADAERQLRGSLDTDRDFMTMVMGKGSEDPYLYVKYVVGSRLPMPRRDAEKKAMALLDPYPIAGPAVLNCKNYWSEVYKAKSKLKGEALETKIRLIDDTLSYRFLDSELKEKIKALVFRKEPQESKPEG